MYFRSQALKINFQADDPAKAGWKVRARLSVKVFPTLLTLDPAPLKVHRLVDADPVEPGAKPAPQSVPASLLKFKRLLWPW